MQNQNKLRLANWERQSRRSEPQKVTAYNGRPMQRVMLVSTGPEHWRFWRYKHVTPALPPMTASFAPYKIRLAPKVHEKPAKSRNKGWTAIWCLPRRLDPRRADQRRRRRMRLLFQNKLACGSGLNVTMLGARSGGSSHLEQLWTTMSHGSLFETCTVVHHSVVMSCPYVRLLI